MVACVNCLREWVMEDMLEPVMKLKFVLMGSDDE